MRKYFRGMHFLFFVTLVFGALFVFFSKSETVNIAKSVGKATLSPILETSSGVPSRRNDAEEKSTKILFAGDMMFDRYIRTQSDKNGKEVVFEGVAEELRAVDFTVANLEGPITSNVSKSVGSAVGESRHFLFTFDPAWAKILFDANIRIVNLGNNHILNFGEAGLLETRKFLQEAKVKFFGDPLNESLRVYIAEIRGKKIGFVNYNQFYKEGESRALADIARLRPNVDVLFVYTHWGAEYVPASAKQKELAHRFIDRGADAVIGSHPHVVQEKEIYQGKTIYYSLGNFVFDQYFSPEVRRGLLVEATIAPDNTFSFRDIPIVLSLDGKTTVKK
jgi:poly-gamma-glutamate synthesis protein (capsule biosynthesis protein)